MTARTQEPVDYLERISRVITLAGFALASLCSVLALVLALSWRHQPFAGFVVEPTLMVSGINGPGWQGREAGINHPQQVIRLDGRPVTSSRDYNRILASRQIGDRISIFTRKPDGSEYLYPAIPLTALTASDTVRIFWLPYFVGLAYLCIGGWIYRLRGGTRPGRALSFFCIVTALVCMLMFDLYTTHVFAAIWTGALATIGGALISLAWRFPEEWLPVQRRSALLAVPYLVSIGLGLWGIAALGNRSEPWAYVAVWGFCYRYTGLGILIFFGMMLYRAVAGANAVVRRQARMVTVGSIVAFTPISAWLLSPLAGVPMTFNPVFLLLPMLLFPFSVALAILRLRLWEVDTFASRAFVYGAVTSILAGVFSALHSFTQKTFFLVTGEESDVATIATTLILVAAFTPLKSRVQAFVDREFRFESEEIARLRAFGEQVEAYVQLSDVTQLARRLLMEAAHSLQAESGAVSLWMDGRLQTLHTFGRWNRDARLSVPLEYGGQRYGLLQLGPHQTERAYSRKQSEALQQAANQVAYALHFGWSQFSLDRRAEEANAAGPLKTSDRGPAGGNGNPFRARAGSEYHN